MVLVEIDRREPESGVPALLRRFEELEVRTTHLKAGDYAIRGAVGIERKGADDLARSVMDGRLFAQTAALRRSWSRPLILVEGLTFGRPVLNVSWVALRGALL